MATVISDEDGSEVEVTPVEAVASVAAVNSLASEYPQGSAKVIEQAMVWAVQKCSEEGVTDPDAIREAMFAAREQAKTTLRMQMNDIRSQQE